MIQVQGYVMLALGAGALAMMAFALVDALRQRTDAFAAAGKLTKTKWLVILAVAVAIGFVSLFGPLNIFNLLAFVAAAVYLADVRPALRAITGRGGSTSGW
ncbi:MAG TPA: DUF2516 family protein [Actinomycetales bacterium]|nr:DUF2516 family protein [Actinomycetales bacterium]